MRIDPKDIKIFPLTNFLDPKRQTIPPAAHKPKPKAAERLAEPEAAERLAEPKAAERLAEPEAAKIEPNTQIMDDRTPTNTVSGAIAEYEKVSGKGTPPPTSYGRA